MKAGEAPACAVPASPPAGDGAGGEDGGAAEEAEAAPRGSGRDTSETLGETIPLIQDKVMEMNHLCAKVHKVEAFVKMVAHCFPS